ncbi:PapD-like protein [Endogone sp. FLAS-F59071]|nr:PapD-like protein [Endogone sp. FLAS-F59071]|eukprot:RUS13559.1 PapD-like protein [Endogone sp. FLAS-F59071]
MSIELEPSNQLAFRRPLTVLIKEILRVKNNNSEPVAFKVKTTAPKQYCVRPNSGRIEPHSEVEVQVLLQPMREDPVLDFKCKDKFLVQSVAITPKTDSMSLQDLWTHAEKEDRGHIRERKVKCIYLPAFGPDDDKSYLNVPPNGPSPSTSTTANPGLTKQSSLNGLHDEFLAASENQPRDDGRRNSPPYRESLPESQIFSNAPSSRPSSQAFEHQDVLTTNRRSEDPIPSAAELARLRSELSDARNTIKQMQSTIATFERELKAANDGLRLRQKSSSAGPDPTSSIPGVGAQDAVHQVLAALKYPPPAEGYPPQVVLFVALVVFIITHFFF